MVYRSDATAVLIVPHCGERRNLLHLATFQQYMRNLRPPCTEKVARAFENGNIDLKRCFFAPSKAACRAWTCGCVSFTIGGFAMY